MRWSEAEVALSDLIARFTPVDLGASEEISAARAFTRLSAESFWTLDTDLPADGVRVLNQRHVTARLDPALEQALAASPALMRQAARTLVARPRRPSGSSRRPCETAEPGLWRGRRWRVINSPKRLVRSAGAASRVMLEHGGIQ
jgi:hypothetical protein